MVKKSLFGYLANYFTLQKENLATEALKYIITQSPAAAQGFLQHIEQTTGIAFQRPLSFTTQEAGNDDSRPDMKGTDDDGQSVLLIEAKFWADLTKNQPTAYIKHLSATKSSALVFIAPESRLEMLWPDLLKCCKSDNVSYGQESAGSLKVTLNNTESVLALTSWRAVLTAILGQLDEVQDSGISADVFQLQAFCDSMDSIAFYPLNSEEFSSRIPQRTFQYKELIKDITAQLKREGVASTEGLSESIPYGTYGRYMIIHNYGCLLEFSSENWAKYREAPLWFRIRSKGWKFSGSAKELLSSLAREQPSRLLEINDWLSVPLNLATGVDRGEVTRSLISQIKEIAKMLGVGKED